MSYSTHEMIIICFYFKLAGVITPNDGLCHLENGTYTLSSEQDYPSISLINLRAKKNAVNVIFAVTSSQAFVYKKLSTLIEGSSSAVLSEDSSNMVDVVRSEYDVGLTFGIYILLQ